MSDSFSNSQDSTITIDAHIEPGADVDAVKLEIMRALTSTPKALTPKWLYDDRGSELFDEITRLDEYYPTEAERRILAAHATEIARVTQADTVVELGSGTSDKTRTLLDAFWGMGVLRRFVPFDVSEATLVDAASMLADRYPGLDVHAVVGDFNLHLPKLPTDGRRMIAFLGSTIGNFHVEERRAFLGALADTLDAGEWLLLGADLVKDVDRIVTAYNDESGVTEAFTLNVLEVLNRQFDGNLPIDNFDFVPLWDPTEERMDIRLRADTPFVARFEALDLDITFGEGEELRVEVSTKFRPERLTAELADAGFEVAEFWTAEGPSENDPADFGLFLARRI